MMPGCPKPSIITPRIVALQRPAEQRLALRQSGARQGPIGYALGAGRPDGGLKRSGWLDLKGVGHGQ